MSRFSSRNWAVILGGSSGFGLAAAQRLSADGMSVAILHRDRRSRMAEVQAAFDGIRETGATLFSLNADALDSATQEQAVDALTEKLGDSGRVSLLLHAVARGNLKPLVPSGDGDLVLEDDDFRETVYAMGTSIATWTRRIHARGLFAEHACVLGLTSEGNQLAWPSYAAVSTAKAALEAVMRSMAVEYGPAKLRCNVLQPGVTDTPALRLIPGFERMLARARERNPLGRLTRPADVAGVIAFLCTEDARWINGAVLRVDGGEAIAG